MTEFRGGDEHVSRIMQMEKQRAKEIEDFKQKKEKMKEESKSKVTKITEKFATNNDIVSEKFTQETVGLVTREDFIRKKIALLDQEEEIKRKALLQEEIEVIKVAKKPRAAPSKLSFSMDDEEEEEEVIVNNNSNSDGKYKLGKNPEVDTAFLPDKDREEAEARERERLANEWMEEQERLKNEAIEITYSYYDGSGHRRTAEVKKGTTVEQFLELVRQEFKELRGVTAENLLFVKEDLIIPHARGKSGPLFNFDVHDDIRVINDASKEKDESHAAKVVERRWYERNKHIFPASRWEIYDPAIQREKYTIHDRVAKN